MELEVIKPANKVFAEIPLLDYFLWLGNIHIKTSETRALNMSNKIYYSFCDKDEVTPCEIQKIIVKLR